MPRPSRTTHRTGYAVGMVARCFLGHGASGTAASMAPFVEGLRARGIDATRHRPAQAQGRGRRCRRSTSWSRPTADVAVGGHSFGGRVASLAAAEPDGAVRRARVLQLPAPSARRARADRRPDRPLAGHPLPGPAAVGRVGSVRPDRPAAAAVATARDTRELVTYPRLGHTLKPVLDDVLDRTAAFLRQRGADRTRAAGDALAQSVGRSSGLTARSPRILTLPQAPARHRVARHTASSRRPDDPAAAPKPAGPLATATQPTLDALTAPSR